MKKIKKHTLKEAQDKARKIKSRISEQYPTAEQYATVEKYVEQEEKIKQEIKEEKEKEATIPYLSLEEEKDTSIGANVITALYGSLEVNNGGDSFTHRRPKIDYKENISGIHIGLYNVDAYPGAGHAMLYKNGFYVSRDDGTYSAGPEIKWRNSAHTYPSIQTIEGIKFNKNKIIAKIKKSDGAIESIEVGKKNLTPIYRVYRDNDAYREFFKEFENLHGTHKLAEKSDGKSLIQEEGSEIISNSDIESIPKNAIVITDKAALEALPAIRDKLILRIDKLLGENSTQSTLNLLMKEKMDGRGEPKKINILKTNIADHPEDGTVKFLDHNGYINYLIQEIKKIYPNIKDNDINIISDGKDMQLNRYEINIIDRHAKHKVENTIYTNPNTIKLPLYENVEKDEYISREILNKKKSAIIEASIKKAEKDMDILEQIDGEYNLSNAIKLITRVGYDAYDLSVNSYIDVYKVVVDRINMFDNVDKEKLRKGLKGTMIGDWLDKTTTKSTT